LEEELKKKFSAQIELIAGSGGVFDVRVDDRNIFSKSRMGRFPQEEEIEQLIKAG